MGLCLVDTDGGHRSIMVIFIRTSGHNFRGRERAFEKQVWPRMRREPSWMKTYRLATETLLDAPLEDVFEFFSKAENLEQLTPRSLRFKILTELPVAMKMGTLIDYKIRIRGVPVRWRTEISIWEPGRRFVDRQLKGPYKQWIHEHRFAAEGNKTRMWDTVDYVLPFGPLGVLAHGLFVKREIEGIFKFREQAINRWLRSRS